MLLLFFISGVLAASYFSWALHRVSASVLISEGHSWPRPFPFPDAWLFHWEQQLEADHPPSPGTMRLQGELPRIRLYLSGWIGLSLLIAIGSFIWLTILRKRSHAA